MAKSIKNHLDKHGLNKGSAYDDSESPKMSRRRNKGSTYNDLESPKMSRRRRINVNLAWPGGKKLDLFDKSLLEKKKEDNKMEVDIPWQ